MNYPMDEEATVNLWLAAVANPDEGDKVLLKAIVTTVNNAYAAGLAAGLRERTCEK